VLILSAQPPQAFPEAVALAIDGTQGALPAVLAPWQRFELGAWGADRRDRWARGVAQARAEGAEEAVAEVLAYYRTRHGSLIAPGVDLEPIAPPPSRGPSMTSAAPSTAPHAPRRHRRDACRPPGDGRTWYRWRRRPPATTATHPSRIPWTPHGALERRPRYRRRHEQRPQRLRRGAPSSLATARTRDLALGAYVGVDQADELPRPPALTRFDVRTDSQTDLEEHRGGHSGPTSPQTWPTGPIDDPKRPPNMTSMRPSRAPVALSYARSMATLEDMPP
jgi:hypothetical protein